MDVVVAYDIGNTDTKEGRRRLRRVAKTCLAFGQRVQYSVFECSIDAKGLLLLKRQLREEMNPKVDSVKIYRLIGGRDECVQSFGIERYVDFDGPLLF